MSIEVLPLGQREIGVADELTAEEIEFLESNDVTLTQLRHLLGVTNSKMTLNAAIGGVMNLKAAFAEGAEVADPRGLGIDPPSDPDLPPDVSDEPIVADEKLPEPSDTNT